LDHYWTKQGRKEEGRIAFLIKVNDEVAGFVLKNNVSSFRERMKDTNTMAEFFIMRKWRRLGIGKIAAHEVFRNFPGHWEVKQMRTNTAAQQFWQAVIHDYTHGHFENIDSFPPKWDGSIQVFNVNS
jgi:predicted acetyltransferase